MTTSREIKKALTKAFKGVKFSVTTRDVLCETITVKWTGSPFILHVKEITDQWNTFRDHSDSQSDYFNYTGVRIKFERLLSSDEEKTVVDMILKMHGYEAQDGKKIEFTQNDYSCHFSDSSRLHGASYWHNKALKQYLYNGQFEEVVVTEEVVVSDEVVATEEVVVTEEVKLIKGDYVDGQTNGKVQYIQIHWHEGLPCIEEDAKFSTFASAHEAILRLYQNQKDRIPEGCYIKLKFSVFYTDGELYTGRLDLCPMDDNPEITDNIIKKHCTEFLDYQRKKGSVVTYDYTFDDFVEDVEDKNIQSISQEWFLPDDKDLQHLTRGVSSRQYQQVITKCFHLDADDLNPDPMSPDNNDLLQKYTLWVQKKIQEGKSSKIVSFDDWLEYQQ